MNNNKELKEILLNAGWFEKRKININDYLLWYQKYGFFPNAAIINILEEFGNLTFRIPFFREIVRSNDRRKAYWEFHISPLYFIDDTFDERDIEDSICYIRDATQYLSCTLYPIAMATDSDNLCYDIFMADTGEIIGAYEGTCGIIGKTFEEALNALMTEEGADFECFQ